MGYMAFKEPALEKLFKNFKWTRNNTIQLFEEAQNNNILNYTSTSAEKSRYTFQPLLFQFQCIISTTDTYYRKLTANKNQNFGVLVRENQSTPKGNIPAEEIKNLLKIQLIQLEELLRDFDLKRVEKDINSISNISNHEYLHQGQMIIDFRETGKELPERFRKSWAL